MHMYVCMYVCSKFSVVIELFGITMDMYVAWVGTARVVSYWPPLLTGLASRRQYPRVASDKGAI